MSAILSSGVSSTWSGQASQARGVDIIKWEMSRHTREYYSHIPKRSHHPILFVLFAFPELYYETPRGNIIGKVLNFFFPIKKKKLETNQSRTATCQWGPRTVQGPSQNASYLTTSPPRFWCFCGSPPLKDQILCPIMLSL